MATRLVRVSSIAAALLCSHAGNAARRPSVDTHDMQALQPVLACRSVATDMARLACFDQATRDLQGAATNRDLVVIDRGTVTKVRRSLFGFATPSLDILDGNRSDGSPQSEISSTIRSARRDPNGDWVVTIEDGAVWRQTSGDIGGQVRPGDKVVIKRASLGSFFLRIGNRPGVRARREG